jgi:hypothetical protein
MLNTMQVLSAIIAQLYALGMSSWRHMTSTIQTINLLTYLNSLR